MGEILKVGDFVNVNHVRGPGDREDWVAKILDIRSRGLNEVYCLVFWIYGLEHLPVKIQSCLQLNELFPSNHVDVIPAGSVIRRASVYGKNGISRCWYYDHLREELLNCGIEVVHLYLA